MYRLVRGDEHLAYAMHSLTFPHDEWESASAYWIAFDETDSPVGFCSVKKLKAEPGAFLTRAGLFRSARGAGLQRRMITTRCNWARKEGLQYVVTYTVYDNYQSIVNLLKCGFRFFTPAHRWAGRDVHYFHKDLTP